MKEQVTIPKSELEALREHSQMLGQIAAVVEDYCSEHHTTLDGVRFLEADMWKWKAKCLELEATVA